VDDFDQIERVTRLVGRTAAVGIPTWIVLLAVLPFTGLGALACLSLATLLAGALVVVVERRRSRGGEAAEEAAVGTPRARRPMGPLTAAALTLGGVALLAYIVFVVRAA
jgi:hypothetical protein